MSGYNWKLHNKYFLIHAQGFIPLIGGSILNVNSGILLQIFKYKKIVMVHAET